MKPAKDTFPRGPGWNLGFATLVLKGHRREPVAILTSAVGIGLNTAIFSLVRAALPSPLPVRAGSRLVHVHTSGSAGNRGDTSSYPDYLDATARNAVFTEKRRRSVL